MSMSKNVNLVTKPKVIAGDDGDFIALRFAENLGYRKDGKRVDTGTLYYDATINEGHYLFDHILKSDFDTGTNVNIEFDFRGKGVRTYESDKSDYGVDGVGVVLLISLFDVSPSLRFASVEKITKEKNTRSRRRDDDDEDEKPTRGRSSRSRRDDDDDEDEKPSRGRSSRSRGADKDF